MAYPGPPRFSWFRLPYRLNKMLAEHMIDVEEWIASGFHCLRESLYDSSVDTQARISQKLQHDR